MCVREGERERERERSELTQIYFLEQSTASRIPAENSGMIIIQLASIAPV